MNEPLPIPAIEMRDAEVCARQDLTSSVIEALNWTVACGEFWVIAGQQHSGKSDLAVTTGGLMAITKGSYKFFGKEVRLFGDEQLHERLRMGFVFETAQLFHHLTIAENVALPVLYHQDLPNADAERESQTLMELMELTPLAELTPVNLNASWLKRAALARSLMLKPEVLVLDNPLGGLDARHSQWWLRFLNQLWRGHEWLEGKPLTIIATTDDLRPWRNDTRRFALLKDKKFIPFGSWQEIRATDDEAVKDLLAVPFEPEPVTG